MAPVSRRLSSVSFAGAYPRLVITEPQFSQLQTIYGLELSTSDRQAIQKISDEFLIDRVRELISQPRSQLHKVFEKLRQAIGPFVLFARGGMLGLEEAEVVVESLFVEACAALPLPMLNNHLLCRADDGELEAGNFTSRIFIRLNPTLLMGLADKLEQAIARVELAIEEGSKAKGFAPGVAFHDFLWHLRDWAKGAGHPISPFRQTTKDDDHDAPEKSASPFSRFIYALNEMLRDLPVPEHIRTADGGEIQTLAESVESPESLADRLKAVAAEANAYSAQGG